MALSRFTAGTYRATVPRRLLIVAVVLLFLFALMRGFRLW
jgi:hypothetical protein